MIYAFVGPSGSGKTAIMRGVQAVRPDIRFIRSLTTRKHRGTADDDAFYDFVTRDEFVNADLVEHVEYAGNFYGIRKSELYPQPAMLAVTEHGVTALKDANMDVVVIRITPVGNDDMRTPERIKDDEARKALITPDYHIYNVFSQDGLATSVEYALWIVDAE